MRNFFRSCLPATILGLALALHPATRAAAADSLSWDTNRDRVSADIQSVELLRLLEGVAKLTGWHVFIESNTTFTVSAKFKDLPAGVALRQMLGDLSFALVPETNSSPRLYVFRSSQKNATQAVHPADLNAAGKTVPNELIVRLRPGANIDELAKALGAKVVGRIDGLNAYRLQFADEAAADNARQQLAGNSDVTSTESNYYMNPPPPAQKLSYAGGVPPVQLKLNPPGDSGRVIVGLIDTGVQPLGNDLDKFILKSLTVAGTANLDPGVPSHGTSMFENILRAASAVSDGGSSLQVLPVRVSANDGTMNSFDVATGVVQAVNNGANLLNLSLGSPSDSQVLHDVIRQATQSGIPVFAAAGNDASTQPYYPAAYPEVNAVTAGNQGKPASYANTGSFVDLIAPGSGVVYFGDSAYLVNGTSTSTAFISGTVGATALAKQAPLNQVVNAILNSPAFQYRPLR